jgi:hypothetical protein
MPKQTSLNRCTLLSSVAALMLATAASPGHAGELYAQVGLPGLMLGYAHPLNAQFGLRVDFATLGSRSGNRDEDGINYAGTLKLNRTALLADWFPLSGGFRLTAGVTANQYKLDLLATGAGGTLTVGNTTYTTTANDRLNVQVKYPTSTPYIGLGWGHQTGNGLRFSLDVGAMIGKAKVSYSLAGPWSSQVSQADLDAELAELRDGVGKVRAVPQISLGLGYSF